MPQSFFIQPGGDITQGLSGIGDALRYSKAKREEEQKVEAAKAAQAEKQMAMQEAFRSGDPAQVASLMGKYPDMKQTLEAQLGFTTDARKKEAKNFLQDVISNPEQGERAYQRRIQLLEAQGRDATETRNSLEDFRENPEAELKQLNMLYAGMASPQELKAFDGGQKDTPRIQDFTKWQAMPEGEEKDGFGRMIGATSRQETVEEYTARKRAEADIKLELEENLNPIAADKKARVDFAADKNKWITGRPKFQSKIGSAQANQTILDSTAEQIKSHLNRMTTEYGASLKGIPGSEAKTLSNLLDTYRAFSAFTTLTDLKASGGTLGAISSAELTLLEAKLGALDQKGTADEMIRSIDQISDFNKGAISRLQKEYELTDAMFSGGFEEAQLNRSKVEEGQARPPQNEDDQALEWARNNPEDPRSQQILQTLGQ